MESIPYEQKKERIREEFRRIKHQGGLSLGKSTSNLFRAREQSKKSRLSVRHFNKVHTINPYQHHAEVEGMTTYETFVEAALQHQLVPPVAPELKSITIGGAVSGIGIESSSFKFGFVHETIEEMDVLTGSGDILTCSPTHYSDLFYAIPNSYGTLGYVLKVNMPLIPAKKFVEIHREQFSDYESYIEALTHSSLEARVNGSYDYIDGLVINSKKMYVNRARFTDTPAFVSDYTFLDIYHKSMNKEHDFLKTEDYIFRYDPDWFWTTKSMGLENKFLRMCLGRKRLRSDFYYRLLQLDNRFGFISALNRLQGEKYEILIQDAEVPVEHAADFLHWFHEHVTQRRPLTIGAVIPFSQDAHFTLFPIDPKKVYMNIGYYAAVPSDKEDGYYNRLFEEKLITLGAKKMMYSRSLYSREEFWNIFDQTAYQLLKATYDPENVFPDLYDKCVLRK